MTKLVEPFKSAQSYIFWEGFCAAVGIHDGDRVWYKLVKPRFFSFEKKVLYAWRPCKGWCRSVFSQPPTHKAHNNEVIRIDKAQRETLQKEAEAEARLSPEDRTWEREQQAYVREAAAKRAKMGETDRQRNQFMKDNTTGKLLDDYIKRNRTRRLK